MAPDGNVNALLVPFQCAPSAFLYTAMHLGMIDFSNCWYVFLNRIPRYAGCLYHPLATESIIKSSVLPEKTAPPNNASLILDGKSKNSLCLGNGFHSRTVGIIH